MGFVSAGTAAWVEEAGAGKREAAEAIPGEAKLEQWGDESCHFLGIQGLFCTGIRYQCHAGRQGISSPNLCAEEGMMQSAGTL